MKKLYKNDSKKLKQSDEKSGSDNCIIYIILMIAIVLSIIAIVISCSKKYDQTSELYDTTNLKCKSGKIMKMENVYH